MGGVVTCPQECGAVDRGAVGSRAWVVPRAVMSGLMHSVAANVMFVIVFFFAAILLTLGMLGFH